MKTLSKILATLLLVAAVLLAVMSKSPDDGAVASLETTPERLGKIAARTAAHTVGAGDVIQGSTATPRGPGTHRATPAEAKDAAIESMNDAATTYDPAELATIRPYLTSADPELRAAAVDAMIVLGDASAGEMLRRAATSMGPGEEATAMMKAADYIELPAANLKDLTRKARAKPPQVGPATGE